MSTLGHYKDNSLISNAFGFLRLGIDFYPYNSDADWIITGVPFDMATSGRSGSREGPSAIRNSSMHLTWEKSRFPWNFNLHDYVTAIDCGDLVYNFGDSVDMGKKLQTHAEKLLKNNKRMLSFGGDHFITLHLLRAYKKIFGPVSLIDFDAHTDDYVSQSTCDHGSIFFDAPKEKLILPKHSIQIGIRTEIKKDNPFSIIDANQVNELSTQQIISKVKKVVGTKPTYLTVDIDCLDPAYAPGTGTPVIGGLNTSKLTALIRGLENLNIIGMDIVEVSPAYDHSGITSLAAATIALEMLYMQASFNSKVKMINREYT